MAATREIGPENLIARVDYPRDLEYVDLVSDFSTMGEGGETSYRPREL